MPPQLGIKRRGFYPSRPRLTGDPAEDVQALARTIEHLVLVVEQLEERLSRRINELLQSGTLANRPTAGVGDRIYLATDQVVGSNAFYDAGTSAGWVTM